MAELIIHQDKIPDNQELIKLCPFGAMEEKDGKVTISAACKMCRLCVRKGPKGAVEYVEDAVKPSIDKSAWKGIAVYVDHVDGKVHPVTLELLGKARELSKVTGHPVYALFMGNGIEAAAHELLHYNVDKVFYSRRCDHGRQTAGTACGCSYEDRPDRGLYDPGNG